MKSYLQRMAASALPRERAIHPILGSLWAPQSRVNSFEASDETLVSDAKPQQSTSAERSSLHSPLPFQTGRIQPPQVDGEQRRSELIPLVEAEAGMPMRYSSEAPRVYESSALLPVASQAERADVSQETGSERPQRNFTPLVAQSSHWDQASPNVTAPVPAAPRVDSLRHQSPAQATHEPDSIEIHIGRIQLLAAQPQQPK